MTVAPTLLVLFGLVLWTAVVAVALALCRAGAAADRTVIAARRAAARRAITQGPAPVPPARRARS